MNLYIQCFNVCCIKFYPLSLFTTTIIIFLFSLKFSKLFNSLLLFELVLLFVPTKTKNMWDSIHSSSLHLIFHNSKSKLKKKKMKPSIEWSVQQCSDLLSYQELYSHSNKKKNKKRKFQITKPPYSPTLYLLLSPHSSPHPIPYPSHNPQVNKKKKIKNKKHMFEDELWIHVQQESSQLFQNLS